MTETMVLLYYVLSIIALLSGTAGIYLAMLPIFSVRWVYYHYFIRKPFIWLLFIAALIGSIVIERHNGVFPEALFPPLVLMGLSVMLTYRMHQEHAFVAVDFPPTAQDINSLPIEDDMQVGVVEYNGVTRAYPLDYVIHHHIINDHFGDRIVALTYCAMCRSIIPFDVTDIGPLFVASFKNANMVVADRKTKTFFQQATFESLIGKLHPHTLSMIPFQILSWAEVKKLQPLPRVVQVSERDFRLFELPIPGLWRRIMASEATPGLAAKRRDKTFPARTRVVGVIDPIAKPQPVYLKRELLKQGIVVNDDLGVTLVGVDNTVLAYRNTIEGQALSLGLDPDSSLKDAESKTLWDLRGKYKSGPLKTDLVPVALSDEYWFSWKHFHPDSRLIRYAE